MSADSHIGETHITNPISHYGIIKLASEKYVTMFCPVNSMEFVIVRPSNVYGPGQIPFRGQGIVATALGSGLNQKPVTIFGKGDNVRDYIYIDDFTHWLVAISRDGENRGIYNAGSGEGHSLMDVVTLAKEALAARDCQLIIEYLPDRPFDVKRNVLDNNKIITSTGIRPAMDLKAGIAQTCAWVEEYLIKQKQPVDGNY
jgi:UDP-glucose 4-epimerase